MQAVQVVEALVASWNPAGQAVHTPVAAVQEEQVVQLEQISSLTRE